ncbi:SRPBCC domain-containing protein [Specibacter sp. NPDC078692]|uniref:SRPBCC family protein n=1 Tax=Specibacter sp. NPDC078692 TaxID=3155818 RepID=UPI003418B7B9
MTVTSSIKSPEALTLAITAEFTAAVERVWQIWEDPRQLERWWGPPNYPATFEAYDFQPGGLASYFMTSPDGTKPRGWWKFTAITAPSLLELDDGFADDNGDPITDMGTAHMVVSLAELDGRTLMTITTTFESTEQMEQMVAMGMEEGMRDAMGQIDAILTE